VYRDITFEKLQWGVTMKISSWLLSVLRNQDSQSDM